MSAEQAILRVASGNPKFRKALQVEMSRIAGDDWCAGNSVCRGNLNIPRNDMPQIKPQFVKDFFAWTKAKYGASTKLRMWKASALKPCQRDISKSRIKSLLTSGQAFIKKNPQIVSRDGYVLDGHHRWAAAVTQNPNMTIPTFTVDLPIRDLLKAARNFPNVQKSKFDFDPNEFR